MIFRLLIIYNHDRMSSITRILHPKTWVYFTSRLPNRFNRSPKEVKEAIMTDINDLVQEFWRTSSIRDIGASFVAMRRLFEILETCSEVCVIISVFATTVGLANKVYSRQQSPILITIPEPDLSYCLRGIERCLIGHVLNPKIWVTCSGSYLVS